MTTTSRITSVTSVASEWTSRQRVFTALNLTGSSVVAAAAGAGSPLFVYEQGRWSFPDSTLTVMFAIYAFTLLLTLLIAGSLSDHLGRRPVLAAALILLVGASLVFLFAESATGLILARALQGIATGTATSTFAAMIPETVPPAHRDRMTQIAGTLPIGGLAVGAMWAGIAAQTSAAPVAAVFVPLIVLIGVAILGAALTPESSARVDGVWRSLVPRVAVPGRLRAAFIRSAFLVAATWMVSGLFLGLIPTAAHTLLGLDSIPASLLVFLQPAVAAISGLVFSRVPIAPARILGGIGCLVGGALVAGGILSASAPLIAAAAVVGGIGNGIGFGAALRPLNAAAHTHERAGVMSAVYVVAYLSYGLPSLIAGQLEVWSGIGPVTVGYAVVIVLTSVAALITRDH